MALTFDDGPFARWTPDVLATLDALGVPATFFMVGRRVDRSPALARRLHDAGHLVANHAYSHKNLTKVPDQIARREILGGRASIRHHTGHDPRFFRPPFSARDEALKRTTDDADQILAHWSISVNDRRATTQEIVDGVLGSLEPGSIVLLHELPQTIRALPAIVAGARARGLRFVTLDGSGRSDGSTQPAGPPRRVTSVTSGHTAGLVLATSSSVDRAFLCRADAVVDIGYGIWAAAWQRAALLLSSADRLVAPYRMQLERLTPEVLVRVGAAVGALDGDEGLPEESLDRPDPAQLMDDVEFEGGRWMVATAAEPCTLLVVAATAARVGAGLLVIDAPETSVENGLDVARVDEELRARGADQVIGVGIDSPAHRELLAAGPWSTRWLDGGEPCRAAANLAREFPSGAAPWLTTPRLDHHTVAAAVAAGSRGAPLLFASEEHTTSAREAIGGVRSGPITVVGAVDELSDELVSAISGEGPMASDLTGSGPVPLTR